MADLPHRQQGREALAPNKDPLSLDQDKETFNHGQAREASHSIKHGKGSPSKNNFVEGGGTDNPQLVNKENLGGKKSRIPDIRLGIQQSRFMPSVGFQRHFEGKVIHF